MKKTLWCLVLYVCLQFPLTAFAENKPITILFLGDSLTAGLGVAPEEAYPVLVQNMLAKQSAGPVKIINGGISGSTSASAVGRLRWYKQLAPDLVFLALGANDGLRGLPLEMLKGNLQKAIDYCLEHQMRVVLAGMEVPPNYGEEYTAGFRSVFKDLAQINGVTLMPFLLEDVGGIIELNQADGIHPNPAGHRIIAEKVLPYIEQELVEMQLYKPAQTVQD